MAKINRVRELENETPYIQMCVWAPSDLRGVEHDSERSTEGLRRKVPAETSADNT